MKLDSVTVELDDALLLCEFDVVDNSRRHPLEQRHGGSRKRSDSNERLKDTGRQRRNRSVTRALKLSGSSTSEPSTGARP